ncbi:MAG: PRC-barrel domain-containing protein [Candidatus Heimdallarchaeota archaeon]|nr:PRC-barrel domain-containing protein [Candidatus Heimdallarchaeota archaeon]
MPHLHLNRGFSDIRKVKIIDADNQEIGKPIDFSVNKKYQPVHFVLGGSKWDEFKERWGFKEDDDPIVSIAMLESADEVGVLRIPAKSSELKNKLQADAFGDNEILFSKLRRLTVHCKDGTKIGRIVDALFHHDNHVDFVIGEGTIIEFLEKIGIMGDFDLLLPIESIQNRDDKIMTIDKSKSELIILLNNEPYHEIDPTRQYGRINLVDHYADFIHVDRHELQ